jgi:predicted CXXCH cytochrome family protein
MKKLLAIAVASLFIVSVGITAAISADAPADGLKVTNFGKKDAVTFDHSKHGTDCASCHHNGVEKGKCGTCHKAEAGDAPGIKDMAHKKEVGKCWGCHNKKSPTVVKALKCKDCHKG